MNAFKVATIVLAVFAGIAIICIIVLIRYFIVRQRTASQYVIIKIPPPLSLSWTFHGSVGDGNPQRGLGAG